MNIQNNFQNYIRDDLVKFVFDMEKVLRRHDIIKGHTDDLNINDFEYLFEKLIEEYREVKLEIANINKFVFDFRFINRPIMNELIDLANVCMMLWNVLRKFEEDYEK
jgi:hypothetical protein